MEGDSSLNSPKGWASRGIMSNLRIKVRNAADRVVTTITARESSEVTNLMRCVKTWDGHTDRKCLEEVNLYQLLASTIRFIRDGFVLESYGAIGMTMDHVELETIGNWRNYLRAGDKFCIDTDWYVVF